MRRRCNSQEFPVRFVWQQRRHEGHVTYIEEKCVAGTLKYSNRYPRSKLFPRQTPLWRLHDTALEPGVTTGQHILRNPVREDVVIAESIPKQAMHSPAGSATEEVCQNRRVLVAF